MGRGRGVRAEGWGRTLPGRGDGEGRGGEGQGDGHTSPLLPFSRDIGRYNKKKQSGIRETLNLSTFAKSCTSTKIIFTTLFYNALNCTLLHCTELQYNALYCTELHCTALYCTAMHHQYQSPSLLLFYINVFFTRVFTCFVLWVYLFPY